jgi:hypothetical protein
MPHYFSGSGGMIIYPFFLLVNVCTPFPASRFPLVC